MSSHAVVSLTSLLLTMIMLHQWRPTVNHNTDDEEKQDPLAKVVDALCTSLRRRSVEGILLDQAGY